MIQFKYKKDPSYHDTISMLFPEEYHNTKNSNNTLGKLACRTITFQVTDNCNLCCTYCYQTNKSTHVMTLDIAKLFIDKLLNNEYSNYISVNNSPAIIIEFIGGEPLLEIELISNICDYFNRKCIELNHPWANRHMFNICSNGVLYFDPKVQDFIRKHNRELSFSVSIDGNKELHDKCRVFPDGSGSYDIAISAVAHYQSHYASGRNLGSKMTLAPQNISYTYDAIVNLVSLGYSIVRLNCVFESGWTTEHATILYYQLKKIADYLIDNELGTEINISRFNETNYSPLLDSNNDNWCGGLGSMTAIDYRGDIYPCIRYMESSLHGSRPPLIIGTVTQGILNSPEHISNYKQMTMITRRSQSFDKCYYCPIAAGCAWCSAYNYQVFGTPNRRTTYTCIMHQAESLANVYFWNRMYLHYKEPKVFTRYCPDDWALKIIPQDELQLLDDLVSEAQSSIN